MRTCNLDSKIYFDANHNTPIQIDSIVEWAKYMPFQYSTVGSNSFADANPFRISLRTVLFSHNTYQWPFEFDCLRSWTFKIEMIKGKYLKLKGLPHSTGFRHNDTYSDSSWGTPRRTRLQRASLHPSSFGRLKQSRTEGRCSWEQWQPSQKL